MSNSRKRAFSLIELLAALSVVMALAVVAFAYGNSYKDNANNSKRLADIDALQNVADTYFRAKSTYPTPKANAIPYDKDGRYAHDNPYGYSSFVTDELFGTEFLREVPRDPANNAYYAYGKQNPGKESPTGSYDFATVDLHEGTYYAYVRGNYDASRLVSLIRAYNSPEFVQNGTDKYLPYDPNAMKLTGRITSSSGAIYVIRSGEKHGPTAFSGELMEGDRIQSSPGSYATMYFADGSEIRLGNATQTGTIDIDALTYKDHSIATRLRLFLREWTLWTKAPKLRDAGDDSSIMEVETDSAVAAVRGTVFGLNYDPSGKMTYSIADGKIDISNGAALLVTLTGATEEYRSLDIQNNRTQPITEPIASFTGGTASGAAILNAIGGWDPNILSTRKPDITAISRSETGIILSLNAIEEDVGRKLCNGTASVTIPETFTRQDCQSIASSGNNTISFTNKELSTFAICTNDGATGNVGNCSANRTISLDSASTFGLVSLDSTNLNCKAEDIFGPFGCLGKDTIAYAGFEHGDLNLYTKSPDGSLIALPLITNASGSSYYTDFGRTTKSSGSGNVTFESGKWIKIASGNGLMLTWVLAYDIHALGIRDSDFAIDITVSGSGLLRALSSQYSNFLWSIGGDKDEFYLSLPRTSLVNDLRKIYSSSFIARFPSNDSCKTNTRPYCSNVLNTNILTSSQSYIISLVHTHHSIQLFLNGTPIGNKFNLTAGRLFSSEILTIGPKNINSKDSHVWEDTISAISIRKISN